MSNGPQLYSDPWAKRNAWRRNPVFSKRQMFANLFPGFGIAVVAFTTYVLADNLVFSQSKKRRPLFLIRPCPEQRSRAPLPHVKIHAPCLCRVGG
ncbi:unnamed protein product [Peniophora sp. CBMAI 1063]|nr:unnamed protein product [Peniophora sp. CBMAI 1063]